MDVVKEEFAQQTPRALAAAVEPVEASLRCLSQAAGVREQAIATRADELQSSIAAQSMSLARLHDALEGATALG